MIGNDKDSMQTSKSLLDSKDGDTDDHSYSHTAPVSLHPDRLSLSWW